MSIQKWDPSVGLTMVNFKKIQFWVQIHDLGLEKFNMENAKRIGNIIGEYVETDKDVENTCRSFLRLKVVVDAKKPLLAGFWWSNSHGNEIRANIKYERLSDFCYGCGKLGHTTQACKEDVRMSESKMGHTMFGPWQMGVRPKRNQMKGTSGESYKSLNHREQGPRLTWFDIM